MNEKLVVEADKEVAAGCIAVIEVIAPFEISIRNIEIGAETAIHFEIRDILINGVSQFSTDEPIPAEAFIPGSVCGSVRFDELRTGKMLKFIVKNITLEASKFRAEVSG